MKLEPPQSRLSAAPQNKQWASSLVLSANSQESEHSFKGRGQNYGNKFHRAALEGYVDMLCEASKRDTNLAAADHPLGLTPTLVAAQYGQLEALRILVGRGGDPGRVTTFGSCALHLAAGRNHLNCVSFLVNFGVNMWSLDNELHTAKDVAAIEQAGDVLDYLDQMMAKQSAINTKLVQKLKDKAKREAEKRLKQMRKTQLKAIKQVERDERLLAKMSQNRRLLKAAHSMSDIKLVGRVSTPLLGKHSSVNLSPRCDLIGVKSRAPTTEARCGRSSPQKLAAYIQQRVQDDLLAKTRKGRTQLIESSNTASSIASSPYPSSSVSSTSGYLSSCSAKSILKSAVTRRRSGCQLSNKSEVNTESHQVEERPKYSDLVAVKQEELSAKLLASGFKKSQIHLGDLNRCANLQLNKHQQEATPSMLTSKLRIISGGVSRKVHLKRLLFNSSSLGESQRGQSVSSEPTETDRIGSLKRFRSEPNFGAALLDKEQRQADEQDNNINIDNNNNNNFKDDDDENEDENNSDNCNEHDQSDDLEEVSVSDIEVSSEDTTRSHKFNQHSKYNSNDTPTREDCNIASDELPPLPPPLPPAPESNADSDPQHLLTRCLSQLKLQQRFAGCDGDQRTNIGAPTTRAIFSHSDELLRHQLSIGEFPLRPSAIKQRLLMKTLPVSSAKLASTFDSIGSAGSLADSNNNNNNNNNHNNNNNNNNHNHNHNNNSGNNSKGIDSSNSSGGFSSPCHSFGGSASPGNSINKNIESSNRGATSQNQLGDFLAAHNLADLHEALTCERIDFEALLLLDEQDLKSLNILLGPRRKLLAAIERHRKSLESNHKQTKGPFLVVDTQF